MNPKLNIFIVLMFLLSTIFSTNVFAEEITEAHSFAFRDNEGDNSVGTGIGDHFTIGVYGVVPDSTAGTTVQAIAPDYSIYDFTSTARPGVFGDDFSYENTSAQGLLGPWELLLKNGDDVLTILTPDRSSGIEKMEFVGNLSIAGSGTTPTISWQLPLTGAPVDSVRYELWDDDTNQILSGQNPVTIGESAEEVTLTGLAIGRHYALRIIPYDFDNNNRALSRSSNWISWEAQEGNASGTVLSLTTGSPIETSQTVDTPNAVFNVEFDYRFTTATGYLQVFLNDTPIGPQLNATTEISDEFMHALFEVDESSLLNLTNVELTFSMDGPAGSNILVDNISFPNLANGDFESDLDLWTMEGSGLASTSQVSESTILYFPHIASGGMWETEVGIINTSGASLSGILYGYNDSGAQVESKEVTLAAGGRTELTLGTDFSNPTQITNMAFETESGCTGYEKFYTSDYRVAIPSVSTVNTGDLYVTHIASDSTWWTGLALFNTTSTEKVLTFTFSDGSQDTLTLAAGQHWAGTIQDSFPSINAQAVESAVISSASGVIGLELFGSVSGSGYNYLSGVLLSNQTATSLYYPHIASDSQWWTGIVSYNPNSTTATLTVTPYDTQGNALGSIPVTIAAKGKYIGTASALNFLAGTAWFKVDSDLPVTGFELFGTHNGKQLAGYSSVNINTTEGTFVKLEQDGWTGIAFVNSAETTANVTLTALNDTGDTIATTTLDLPANGKQVALAENLFATDISAATCINFSSDQEVVGFQLNGSADEMMLDGLPGVSN